MAAGLLPSESPNFLNGFTRNYECWFYNQTSPYYRRHLLLHEGVHGFMYTLLGRNAPPWYMEGMAELLATHRWQDGKLELPYFPKRSDEVPKLGRIEIVQKDFAAGQAKQFPTVMDYSGLDYLQVEPYGWSWAAAAFLNGNPHYRDRFHKLPALLSAPGDFNAKFREAYADDFEQLLEAWQIFMADIAYGYDFDRTASRFYIRQTVVRRHGPCNSACRSWLAEHRHPTGSRKKVQVDRQRPYIKWPTIPNPGSANPAAFPSATSTASRWEFCWQPCGRRNRSSKPNPANQMRLATLNQTAESAHYCSPS